MVYQMDLLPVGRAGTRENMLSGGIGAGDAGLGRIETLPEDLPGAIHVPGMGGETHWKPGSPGHHYGYIRGCMGEVAMNMLDTLPFTNPGEMSGRRYVASGLN